MPRHITWDELGAPFKAGEVWVEGLGRVAVSEANIETANEVDGGLKFVLIETKPAVGPTVYALGPARRLE